MIQKISILGAGSWGLTLAWLASLGSAQVTLWDRNREKLQSYAQNRQITFPVEITLPESIQLTDSLAQATHEADVIILVVTSAGTRSVLQALKQVGLSSKTVLINASKGVEYPSLKPLSTVFSDECPENPFAVLSGPTLAKEILNGLPTCASIASSNPDLAEFLQLHLSSNRFRLYSNTDVIGVELGGALKNVFAIASGYMQARQLGENARAALITRGLAEMTRLSTALGADEQTLYGLSGLGDLLATCNSPLSRNYQVGYRLAKGETLTEILNSLKVVAEGVQTSQAVARISEQYQLDTPIIHQVEHALSGNFSEEIIIKSLMGRKLKSEHVSA